MVFGSGILQTHIIPLQLFNLYHTTQTKIDLVNNGQVANASFKNVKQPSLDRKCLVQDQNNKQLLNEVL